MFSASYWSFLLAPAPAMLAARACGKRVVLHYHSGEADDHLARWGRSCTPGCACADRIVVPSAVPARRLRASRLRGTGDPERRRPASFRYRERDAAAARGSSRPATSSATTASTRSCARSPSLRARGPDATLTVAGEGSQAAPLRRLAADLGDGGVRFVGRVEPERMPACSTTADILLNASLVDNQPVTLLEAFAAGLPVVTTPTGDIASLVRDGETGRLVPPGDPAAMARAVGELLAPAGGRAPGSRSAAAGRSSATRGPVAGRAWMDAVCAGGRLRGRGGMRLARVLRMPPAEIAFRGRVRGLEVAGSLGRSGALAARGPRAGSRRAPRVASGRMRGRASSPAP